MTDSLKQETKANTALLDQAIEIFTKRMDLDGNEIMRDAKRAAMQEVFHFFQTNQVSENVKPYDANSASAFWKGVKSGGNETLISDCGIHTADIDLPNPRPGLKDGVWMGKIQCHGSTEAEAIELRDAVLHAINSLIDSQATQPAKVTDGHPMQPVVVAENGRIRFKKNQIVDDLYELHRVHKLDLNEMARRNYSQEDRNQFAQLIGYSVDGWSTLSYAMDVEKAEAIADSIATQSKKEQS